jgi:uncharacterized membrane protein
MRVMEPQLQTFVWGLPLLIGVVAGSRAMTAPAAVSWAASWGSLALGATPLAFLAHPITHWVFTVFALGELVTDQLPSTPSRTVPVQFGTRIVTGALSGAAIAAGSGGTLLAGGLFGAVGAVIGTLGGRRLRGWLAGRFGSDLPAALIEDALAIGGAILIVVALR